MAEQRRAFGHEESAAIIGGIAVTQGELLEDHRQNNLEIGGNVNGGHARGGNAKCGGGLDDRARRVSALQGDGPLDHEFRFGIDAGGYDKRLPVLGKSG